MIQVHAVGATDVGKVREANEDAYLVGASVFAVADGMGGHLAGEVASSTALEPVRAVDGRVFPDAASATTALRDSVIDANDTVVSMADGDPSFRGMGTTLTAVLVEGRRAHIAHVGDSRAYLLRDGGFSQLTDDHTLVRRLIEQGRLTEEEAATHPQRSVITRAIGVEPTIDVDAMSLDLDPGDVVLLCSDGLTGVVPDETIADLLELDDTDEMAAALIAAANAAGGPDNITVVILRVEGLPNTEQEPARPPVLVQTRPDSESENWAGDLGRLGRLAQRQPGSGMSRGVSLSELGLQRWVGVLVVILVTALVLGFGGRFLLSRSYYVGIDRGVVTIYQGIPSSLGPIDLHWVVEATDLTLEDLPEHLQDDVTDGVTVTSESDARALIDNYRTMSADAQQ